MFADAMEWLSTSIKVWYFSRTEIPSDIAAGNPDPSTWGAAVLNVGSNCDIDAHFRNMRIVIDTTFCGDWAGNQAVWEQTNCFIANPVTSNTCVNYVRNNPQAYRDAYWDFKSIKVYDLNPGLVEEVPPASPTESIPADQPTQGEPSTESSSPTATPTTHDAAPEFTATNPTSVNPIFSHPGNDASFVSPSFPVSTPKPIGSCPAPHKHQPVNDISPENDRDTFFTPHATAGFVEATVVEPGNFGFATANPEMDYLQASHGSRVSVMKSILVAFGVSILGVVFGIIER